MKLRGRLALIVLATTIPLVAGALFAMNSFWDHAAVQALREAALFRMEHGGRAQCDADPETFVLRPSEAAVAAPGGARPRHRNSAAELLLPEAQRAEIHAYRRDFESANAAAPPFPAELRDELERGEQGPGYARRFVERDRRRLLVLATWTPWTEGPCALIVATQDARRDMRAMHDLVVGASFVGVGLVLAVLLAAGPAVARIRALSKDVRRAAAERWASPVEARGCDEIADLAREFNAAGAEVRAHVEALERRERTLREFVANTDHDLTVPLTVLLGQLAEMRRRADAGEPADAAAVREAAKEADYLAALVRNLGVAARLEAGEPTPARAAVDLNALVERVVARHRPAADAAGVSIGFAVPESVVATQGDETLLEQAFGNLVHNAVRHNRPGGHVAVTLEAPRAPGGTFVLRVADDGPGVAADELERLGERGRRGAAARGRLPGEGGLGLHIARTIVERHGMRLDLRPREGGGFVAEVRGPRQPA